MSNVESSQKMSKSYKFFILILLMFSSITIYAMPYLRFTYFEPLQKALGLVGENSKYGLLSSVYGIANLIFYLPGGWIADKFKPKKLLVFSLVSTGALGVWLSTFPGYEIALAIHFAWGITTVLTFWSAYIKIVNVMSSSDEQGEMFGWLEGGQGIIGFILNMGFLALFANLGGTHLQIHVIIKLYSAIVIGVGLMLQFFLPEKLSDNEEAVGEITVKQIIEVLKMKTTWLVGAIIFLTFIFVAGGSYLLPYLQLSFGMTAVMAGVVGIIRSSGIKIISAPVFGYMSKAQGRSTRVITFAFVGLIVLSIMLLVIPANESFLYLMIAVIIGTGFFSFGLRGVYWAVVDECKTPKYMVGTVVGVASIIGFIPDAFIYSLFGEIMDSNPGVDGFKIIFMIFLACGILGTIVGVISDRKVKHIQSED